jgi:hypothetical protein
VLFYADVLNLFLPVSGFQACMKIQSDLNKLSEWCERNSLFLNVDKCQTITFSRTCCSVELLLDRVSSINDLDEKMKFFAYVDVRLVRLLQCWDLSEDSHSRSYTFYMSLVHPKLEYASCVWKLFYDMHADKVERVQRRFIRYALRGLGWTDTYDLPPYEHRCALLRLDTLVKRRSIACIMFIFDVLSVRMNSPHLLSALDLNNPRYRTQATDFL